MRLFQPSKYTFAQLSEQQILALCISSEEEDARIYKDFAFRLREQFPDTAKMFDAMAAEEHEHRRWLIDLHKQRFGDHIPLIRREHVSGFYNRRPQWLNEMLNVSQARQQAAEMETQAWRFYQKAAERSTDANQRKLLGDLAEIEAEHISKAEAAEDAISSDTKTSEEEKEHKQFVLTYVQPGLAGLMDGSVSTLAPIFATAFATQNTWTTFLVGVAASVGAGISMGFTEIASDDGVISGRGAPTKRGLATGIMTTIGGLGHALPYLIPDFWIATWIAIVVVFVELWAISWIQHKYMQTSWSKAIFQVVLGGALVFAAGVWIGGG